MPHIQRSKRWYIAFGSILAIAAIYGLVWGGWTVSLVAVVLGGIYALNHGTQPAPKHISLTSTGVFYDGFFTRWEDCQGFWILKTPTYERLMIPRKDPRQGSIMVLLDGIDPMQVKWTLSQFLSEETHRTKRLLDKIIRICQL